MIDDQAFYRFQRYRRQVLRDAAGASSPVGAESSVNHSIEGSTSVVDSGDGGYGRGPPSRTMTTMTTMTTTTTTTTKTTTAVASRQRGRGDVLQAERRHGLVSRRMEYAMGMIGRQATLARLRKSRRLPLTEAAYNGHHEVLQVGCNSQPDFWAWISFLVKPWLCRSLDHAYTCPSNSPPASLAFEGR